MRIKEMQVFNRAPFDNLLLSFDDSNIAVLSGINGAGKTTIISYIVDAMYEFAKKGFSNEFESVSSKFYMVSSNLPVIDKSKESFVYIRFINDGKKIDYIDIRNVTEAETYGRDIRIENPIPFTTIKDKIGTRSVLKYFTVNEAKLVSKLFDTNLLTYFPAYRYEQPAYLNDPYAVNLAFKKDIEFSGYLANPIEVTSDLQNVANWIMDIVLDSELYQGVAQTTFIHLNKIFSSLLNAKIGEKVRLGIGPRQNGATRIQVVKQSDGKQVYPSIFNMSSGEHALISLFCEITRQADNIGKTFNNVTGIVLIDEIDKHLHIKLQKDVLPDLMRLFPNIQFVVTSHSPFFSLGLADKRDDFYKIYDLDNNGIVCTPYRNELFNEVYEMMITENQKYAQKYNAIVEETVKNTVPIVITEGKTDWKHIKAAMKALELQDLNIEIYEYDYTMGDESLWKLLEQFAITVPNRKIIGLFDRDNDGICSRICGEGKSYKKLSNNIFAVCLPSAYESVYGPYTSIEHYYPKENLLKRNVEGRRLFLGEEFFESGMSKDKQYFTRFKGIQNKVKVNGVIDDKVYCLFSDPEFKTSIALTKDDFAQMILDSDEFAEEFEFAEFKKIFDLLHEVVSL